MKFDMKVQSQTGLLVLCLVLVKVSHSLNLLEAVDDPFDDPWGTYTLDIPDNVTNPRWMEVRDILLREYADTCGTSRLCNTSGYESYLTKPTCNNCDVCFCDQLCFQYGDCCLDRVIDDVLSDEFVKETNHITENSQTECVDVRFKALEHHTSEAKMFQRLFTMCQANFHDKNVVDSCEKSGDINQFLLDSNATSTNMLINWPVVSKTTSRSYKNRACATCNDDEESLISWDLEISCQESIPSSSTSSPQNVLLSILRKRDCQLAFHVPEPFQRRDCQLPSRDYPVKEVNVCNATGERETFDLLLWKTCETYSQAYLLPESTVYRNMFCYYCQTDQRRFEGQPTCGTVSGFPFVLVFSPDALQQIQDAQSQQQCSCPTGYVYDVYKKICRKLTCANGKVFSNKECVSQMKTFVGLVYSVSFRLQASVQTNERIFPSSQEEFKRIASNLRDIFLDKIFGQDKMAADLQQFLVQIFVTSLDNSLHTPVNIDIFTKVTAKTNLVSLEFEDRLLSLNKTEWNIELHDGGNSTFTSKLIPEPSEGVVNFVKADDVSKVFLQAPDGTLKELFLIDLPDVKVVSPWKREVVTNESIEVKNTLVCPTFVFNLTHDDDVKLTKSDNWTETGQELVHNASGVRLSFLDFSLIDDEIVLVCADEILKEMDKSTQFDDVNAVEIFGAGLVVTSHVCLSISALTLALTFLTYCMFPSLRTLPGKCTTSLVFTLFLAIVLFQVGGSITDVTAACQVVGVVTHFFLLSSFTWMVICTFHMYRVFSNLMDHVSNDDSHYPRFFRYFLISIILPSLVIAATISVNHLINSNGKLSETEEDVNSTRIDLDSQLTFPRSCELTTSSSIGYGDGVCYVSNKYSLVFASALPITLLCMANLALFIMTLYSLRKMTNNQKMIKKDAKSDIFIYVKLSSLTGINWLPCTVAAFVSSPLIWYFFLILCGLQGVYVFLAFVLNKRVLKLYRQLFKRQTISSDAKIVTSQEPYRNHRYQVPRENGGTQSDDVKTLSTDSRASLPSDPGASKEIGVIESTITT